MADETTTDQQPGDAAQPLGGAAGETSSVAEGGAGEAKPSGAGNTVLDDSDAFSRYNGRKVREGVVTSSSMDKTAVVTVTERVRHRLYGKTVQRTTKLYVHDEGNECNVGDKVRIQETRPLSAKKRWRLIEIVERAR